jgi:hypothetical protein
MTSKTRARVCLFVFVALLWGGTARAQTNGTIRGTVVDQSGAVVPGTVITVVLSGTDTRRSVTADKDGSFDIPELTVGSYELSADAKGFKKYVEKDIVVTIGHVNLVTVNLVVGGSADTVTVEANAAQVETTSTQLGAVMTDTAIRELPMATRNAYSLLQLQPGVQSQVGADLFLGSDNAGAVSVNGGRGRSNNYMVNGGDGNDIFINAPAIQPSPDAIEEFRVITNTFDAEYGRNSGSVVNVVTKSGTNSIHGDFYEFLRNQALNSQGYFDPFLLDYKQNQFGATLGGPIKKDKTFIFGSYEGNRLIQGISSGNVTLPTSGEAAGNFAGGPAFDGSITDQAFAQNLESRSGCSAALTPAGQSALAAAAAGNTPQLFQTVFANNIIPTQCFDSTALALYQKYVAPFGAGTLATAGDKRERGDQFTVRFDHKINAAQQFSAYYYFNDDNAAEPFSDFELEYPGGLLPGFGALNKTRVQQWNLSHTWTIGSTAVNEARFNYFREGQQGNNHPLNTLPSVQDSCGAALVNSCFTQTNSQFPTPGTNPIGITSNIPGRQGVPYITVLGGFTIGNNFEGELPQAGNTFQFTDNFTKSVGKHTIKFGGDVRRQQFNQFYYFNINGDYTFLTDGNLCAPSNPNFPNNCDAPITNDVGFSDAYPDYFIGTANEYTQGAAQRQNDRNSALYLFAQDSYKLKPNLTLSYGLRWELNTPYYDEGNRLQTFRPGQATQQYPCLLNLNNPSNPSAGIISAAAGGSTDCSETGPANSVFPLGLVFPGDKGVPRGLTSTDYKGFAPRVGIAWSPGWTEGWLAKLTGGPGNSSIRAGYGIFYNPIEQLVLAQFSAEPPFGGSIDLSNPNFNTPFLLQDGTQTPNVFGPVISQSPKTPCFQAGGPNGCVDWSAFRPILLFGEFDPHLKTQYADQYNLTIERQLTKSMVLRVSYVGTQGHHLLAVHDENAGNIQTCLGLMNLSAANPNAVLSAPLAAGGVQTSCGPFSADSSYFIPGGTVIPAGISTLPPEPFHVPSISCSGLVLPYTGTPGGNPGCLPAGIVPAGGITLVGTRPFSSPNCQPSTGAGCPADGVPVFSNIFAEGTIANSNYNALQISAEKSYSHGLLFQASYTFSKAIDQGASFENELNPVNFDATRGLSLLDAKHRFVFSPVWELPVPKYDGFKGKALDGWGMSSIITYQTGFPIRVQTQDDLELESSFNFEDANTPQITGPVQFTNPRTVNPALGLNHNWFNTSNIADPAAGSFGNLPHSLCCGPPLNDTDLVISKKTPISERWNTEFRAEFYNTWNHTQFNNPDGNFSDSTFGQILKVREGPRVMQFGLKFLF